MRISIYLFLIMTLSTNVFAEGTTIKAIETLKAKLNRYGAVKIEGSDDVAGKKTPSLYFGKKKINNTYDVVDDVKKNHGGTATIFVKDGQEFVRISTNVLKDDGTRATGTPLAHNKAYDSALKGEKYCGDIEILGGQYDTCYEPIKDSAGAILGIFYVGYKK
jgi:hypothetical protein